MKERIEQAIAVVGTKTLERMWKIIKFRINPIIRVNNRTS